MEEESRASGRVAEGPLPGQFFVAPVACEHTLIRTSRADGDSKLS